MPAKTRVTIQADLSISCHLTRAKLLSIQISRKYTARTTTTASTIESGFDQMKNMATHPMNSTFSRHARSITGQTIAVDGGQLLGA